MRSTKGQTCRYWLCYLIVHLGRDKEQESDANEGDKVGPGRVLGEHSDVAGKGETK